MSKKCRSYVDHKGCKCLQEMLRVKLKHWIDYQHCKCVYEDTADCYWLDVSEEEILKHTVFEFGKNYKDMFKEMYNSYNVEMDDIQAFELKLNVERKYRINNNVPMQKDLDLIIL